MEQTEGKAQSRFWFWAVAAAAGLAILIRVGYACSLGQKVPIWEDERVHDQIAWRLATTGVYASSAYRAAPLTPGFLAAVYAGFGHSYLAARIVQGVMGGILLVLAISGIGAILFDRATGLVAGLGVALYPQLIYLSGAFYAEHLFAVLLAGTVWGLVRWQRTGAGRWLAAGGAALGLSILCRPVALGTVPFLLAFVVWHSGRGQRLASVFFLLTVGLVVTPWLARNSGVFGHYVISTGGGLHLWLGNNEVSRGDADDRHAYPRSGLWQARVAELPFGQREAVTAQVEKMHSELAGLDEVEADRRLGREGGRWLREHPAEFARQSFRRLLTLYSAFSKTLSKNETTNSRNRLIAAVSFYPVLALGLIGAGLAWRREGGGAVLAVIAGLTLIYLPLTACTRFRLPLDSFWILLASGTLVAGGRGLRDRIAGRSVGAAAD